jgi:hypothetical protein
MAGFEVTINGRFWVTAEDKTLDLSFRAELDGWYAPPHTPSAINCTTTLTLQRAD